MKKLTPQNTQEFTQTLAGAHFSATQPKAIGKGAGFLHGKLEKNGHKYMERAKEAIESHRRKKEQSFDSLSYPEEGYDGPSLHSGECQNHPYILDGHADL